jgi:halimadienyl-diphosphate synthase
METFTELFEMGTGMVIPTAYDTAWVARLEEIDKDISNKALAWLCQHQLSDGSWGAREPFYYHDRVISTLAAMIALAHRGKRLIDRIQIEKGLVALEQITNGATRGLIADHGATVGFEMIVPTLVLEAERIGIIKRQGDRILGKLARQRAAKLEILGGRKVNCEMPLAFSSEMAGEDSKGMLDINNLLEKDGSVSHSPSATAYFLLQIQPDNQKSLEYLKSTVSDTGGVSYAVPFEICELAWVLWNVGLLEHIDDKTLELCKPGLEYLRAAWNNKGVGFSAEHSVVDGDDTSVVFDVLTRFGYKIDPDALFSFEEKTHFRCYTMEIANSISTNVHFLRAFRQCGFDSKHPVILKITDFLRRSMQNNSYWFDKWNASPFYTTAHAIISLIGIDDSLAQNAVNWILANQQANGSWGYYNSTAEETAYALQVLCIWKRHGCMVSKDTLTKGSQWLRQHGEPPYPYLWLAKTQFYSEWIIRAEILSALKLVDEAFQ